MNSIWSVHAEVDKNVKMVSVGSLEECIDAANRELLAMEIYCKGNGDFRFATVKCLPEYVVFTRFDSGFETGAVRLDRNTGDYPYSLHFDDMDELQEFKVFTADRILDLVEEPE